VNEPEHRFLIDFKPSPWWSMLPLLIRVVHRDGAVVWEGSDLGHALRMRQIWSELPDGLLTRTSERA